MKKHCVTFSGKLAEVRESFFTLQGSPFYYLPGTPHMLDILRKWKPGIPMRLSAYKLSPESSFYRVKYLNIDRHNSIMRAITRRVIAINAMDKLTIEGKASKMKINGSGVQSGLSGKGIVKNKGWKTKPGERQ